MSWYQNSASLKSSDRVIPHKSDTLKEKILCLKETLKVSKAVPGVLRDSSFISLRQGLHSSFLLLPLEVFKSEDVTLKDAF